MEMMHRRLGINRVDRDKRSRHHQQIDRAIADNLVGNVHVAALGVLRLYNLRHRVRLVQTLGEIDYEAVPVD